MKISKVSYKMYRKFFLILSCVFFGVFLIEFVACLLGNPIGEIYINDVQIKPNTFAMKMLYPFITASFISGIVNFFLTVRIIKELLGYTTWPTVAVVLMTVYFVLELLIMMVLVVPNIIIFGIKGLKKNRYKEIEF